MYLCERVAAGSHFKDAGRVSFWGRALTAENKTKRNGEKILDLVISL